MPVSGPSSRPSSPTQDLELDLSGLNLSPEKLDAQIETLSTSHYQIINLSLQPLTPSQMEKIASSVTKIPCVKKLLLTNTHLDARSVKPICALLKQTPSLEELDLRGNCIFGQNIAKFYSAIPQSNTFSLKHDPDPPPIICNLSNSQELDQLLNKLEANQIFALHINGASIQDSSLYSLFQALKFNSSLETLSLNSCLIDNEKALRLFEALTLNTTLRTLILDNNTLGGDDFHKIILLIKQNKGLTTLSHKGTNIYDADYKTIEQLLKYNRNLDLPPPNIEEIILKKPLHYTPQEEAYIDLLEEITEQKIKKLQGNPLLFFTLIAKLVRLIPQEFTAFLTPENRHSKKIELLYITTNALLDQIISEFNTNSHQLYAHAHCLGICFSLLLACENDEPFIQRKERAGDTLVKIDQIKTLLEHFERKEDRALEFELKRLFSYLQYFPAQTPSLIKQLLIPLTSIEIGTGGDFASSTPKSLFSLPKLSIDTSYITPHVFQAMAFWATESVEKVSYFQQFIHEALLSKDITSTKAMAALTSLEFVIKYGLTPNIQKQAWENQSLPLCSLKLWGTWEHYRQQEESTRYTICRILRELCAHPNIDIAKEAKDLFKILAFREWSHAIQNFIETPTEYDLWIRGKIEEEGKVAASSSSTRKEKSLNLFLPKSFHFEDKRYIPRDEEEKIKKALAIPNTLVAITSLTGGGGVGKTHLAKHLFLHPPIEYKFRAWFEAESPETLIDSYRELGVECKFLDEKTPPEKVLTTVLEWLDKQENPLLIYDNATDYQSLKPRLPKNGTVLITSRNTQWPTVIEVDVMTPSQAETLIQTILDRNDPLIPELAEEMGYLPLALAQSASHIRHLRVSIEKYLKLFRACKKEYLDKEILPQGDRHISVWATVKLSYESLQEIPQALELFTSCAFLAPNGIPSSLVEKLFSNEGVFLETRAILANLSLIQVDEEKETLSIHRLVQTVLIHLCSNPQEILEKLIPVFNKIYPWEKPTMNHYTMTRVLLPHGEMLLSHCKQEKLEETQYVNLIDNLAHAASDLGDYHKSKELYTQALVINKRAYGNDHVNVAWTLGNLGSTEKNLGHYAVAKELYTQVLSIMQKKYSNDHVDVAILLQNLGNVEVDLGHFAEAKEFYTQTLTIRQRAYGPNHVNVAMTLQNLGNVEKSLGHFTEAKEFYTQALAINKREYGNDHVIVAATIENLGNVERELGNFAEAKELCTQALDINRREYDKDHVYVARTLLSLGTAEWNLGNFAKAKELCTQALDINRKKYGEDSVHVAMSLDNLGNVERELGNFAEAKKLFTQALTINQREYGDDHVYVARTLDNLGNVEMELGNFAEAKKLFTQALTINQREYGDDHVYVARTLNNLGSTESQLGNYAVAKELYIQALAINQREYGEDSVDIARTLQNLGNVESGLGNFAEAKKLYTQALAINQREYGDDHVYVARTLDCLGSTEGQLGNYAVAKELYTQALAINLREYGPDHIKVAATLQNLGNAEIYLGHFTKAKELYTQVLIIMRREYGNDHVYVADPLRNLGLARMNLNQFAEAKEIFFQALDIMRCTYGNDHVEVAIVLENYAKAKMEVGHFAEAKEHFLQALKIYRNAYEESNANITRTLHYLNELEERQNQLSTL